MTKSRVSTWVGRRTTFELLSILAAMFAVMFLVSWFLGTLSTHTLAVLAVFFLIFRGGRS
jgi:hypothetical protein